LPFFSPGRAKKRHSFHDWRIGRSEALSTPEARRGAEASTAFFAARSCTSGVDRRSRTEPRVRREMNVEPVVQPKAAPHCFWGGALRGGNGPVWMGSVERQFHWRSQRGKGRSRLPAKESSIDRRVSVHAHRDALRSEKTRLGHGRIEHMAIHLNSRCEAEEQPITNSAARTGTAMTSYHDARRIVS
jgi:hypothetical protein